MSKQLPTPREFFGLHGAFAPDRLAHVRDGLPVMPRLVCVAEVFELLQWQFRENVDFCFAHDFTGGLRLMVPIAPDMANRSSRPSGRHKIG